MRPGDPLDLELRVEHGVVERYVVDLCRRGDASVTAWPRSVIDSSHHSRADDYAYRVASGVAPGTAGIRDDAASRRLSIL